MNFNNRKKGNISFLLNTIVNLSKRQKFVVAVIIQTSGLILTQILSSHLIFYAVGLLCFISLLLSLWCLAEDLNGADYFTLTIPQIFFTGGIALFYFLLPFRWITRLPVALLYGVGIYALLLTQNIFNVASIRTIALLRAARSINLLFALITSFLLFNIIFSMHWPAYGNFILIMTISISFFIVLFWGEKMTTNIGKDILKISFGLSFIVSQLSLILSFWPVNGTFKSLYLVAVFYTLAGIIQSRFKEMPIKNSIWEYLILNLLAMGMILITTSWQI